MKDQKAWVELGPDRKAVRIFKNKKSAVRCIRWPEFVSYVLRAVAVTEIRRKIWDRDKHTCTHCGAIVTWYVMQMHERIWRGRGGEISVDNGTTLCENCHQHDEVAGHGKRKIKWSA